MTWCFGGWMVENQGGLTFEGYIHYDMESEAISEDYASTQSREYHEAN